MLWWAEGAQEDQDDREGPTLHEWCRSGHDITVLCRLLAMRSVPHHVFAKTGVVLKQEVFNLWLERTLSLRLRPNRLPELSWSALGGTSFELGGSCLLPRSVLCVRHVERTNLAISTSTGAEVCISLRSERQALGWFFAIHEACLKSMVDGGATPDGLDINGRLPLHVAIQHENWEAVGALVAAYPQAVEVCAPDTALPLHTSLQLCAPKEILSELLQAYPFSAVARDPDGILPLHLACRYKCWHAVPLLLDLYKTGATVTHNSKLPVQLAWEAREWDSVVALAVAATEETLELFRSQALEIPSNMPASTAVALVREVFPAPRDWSVSHVHVFCIAAGAAKYWDRIRDDLGVVAGDDLIHLSRNSLRKSHWLPSDVATSLLSHRSHVLRRHNLLPFDIVTHLPPALHLSALNQAVKLQGVLDQENQGRWGIVQCVASSSHSIAVRATDSVHGTDVVLKAISAPDGSRLQSSDVTELERRLKVLASVQHPGLCSPVETTAYVDASNEHAWALFQLPSAQWDATTLATHKEDNRKDHDAATPFRELSAIDIALQLVEAAATLESHLASHQAMFVHNVAVVGKDDPATSKPHVAVLSIGSHFHNKRFAGAVSETDADALHTSPECLRGESQGSDVWSIGTVLYWLVCGTMPFATRSEIVDSAPVTIPSTVSESVSIVLRAALDKDASQRISTAAELRQALVRARVSLGHGHFHVFIGVYSQEDVGFGTRLRDLLQQRRIGPQHDPVLVHLATANEDDPGITEAMLSRSCVFLPVLSPNTIRVVRGQAHPESLRRLWRQWSISLGYIKERGYSLVAVLPVVTASISSLVPAAMLESQAESWMSTRPEQEERSPNVTIGTLLATILQFSAFALECDEVGHADEETVRNCTNHVTQIVSSMIWMIRSKLEHPEEWSSESSSDSGSEEELIVRVPPGPIGVRLSRSPPLEVLEILPRPDGSRSALNGIVAVGARLKRVEGVDATTFTREQFKARRDALGQRSCELTFTMPNKHTSHRKQAEARISIGALASATMLKFSQLSLAAQTRGDNDPPRSGNASPRSQSSSPMPRRATAPQNAEGTIRRRLSGTRLLSNVSALLMQEAGGSAIGNLRAKRLDSIGGREEGEGDADEGGQATPRSAVSSASFASEEESQGQAEPHAQSQRPPNSSRRQSMPSEHVLARLRQGEDAEQPHAHSKPNGKGMAHGHSFQPGDELAESLAFLDS